MRSLFKDVQDSVNEISQFLRQKFLPGLELQEGFKTFQIEGGAQGRKR
jgi:hypothetical protein